MALRTNRKSGDRILASDVNDIATVVNTLDVTSSVDVPVALGVTSTRYQIIANSTVGTSRVPIYFPFDCTDVSVVYTAWGGSNGAAIGDTAAPADVPIRCGLEISGTIHRVSFVGHADVTLAPFGLIKSEPISVAVPAGWHYVRTYTNGIVRYDSKIAAAAGDGGFTATTDLTAPGSGAIADTTGLFLTPSIVLGRPTGSAIKTVFAVGDSIVDGIGDGTFFHAYNDTDDKMGRGGFVARAAKNNAFGLINVAVSGEYSSQWSGASFVDRRLPLSRYCKTCVCDLSNNDIYTDLNLATTQASTITVWRRLTARGLRTFATNNLPRTTSTDGWTTTGNQTAVTGNTQRAAYNNWMRDGAPITISTGLAATTGVAAGGNVARCNYFTGNVITKAAENATSHPLYGTIEIADTVESARDSGLWRAPYATRTVTDGAATNGSGTITSATANFTSADKGSVVSIAGAGAAGALYVGRIVYINSTTSANIYTDVTPGTTVTGATMKIYDAASADGIHPWPLAAEAIAGILPTNYFI